MNNGKKALICGVCGQDGAYLARLLLEKGYEVFGTSRSAHNGPCENLVRLGVLGRIKLLTMLPDDLSSVDMALSQSQPNEIYALAGQSSVGASFVKPAETIQGIVCGTLNLLEANRRLSNPARIFFAGSGECFGDTNGQAVTELTPFNPRSPYATAKASSFWMVSNYRDAYGVFACTGILFNHESPLRPAQFVTRKIISAAKRIAGGSDEKLMLGKIDIARDWGWAPEYVEAMWRMLQQDHPDDYIIATGKTYLLEEFVDASFSAFGLDWQHYVEQSPEFFRPTDVKVCRADPTKAKDKLGWHAEIDMPKVVDLMIKAELNNI